MREVDEDIFDVLDGRADAATVARVSGDAALSRRLAEAKSSREARRSAIAGLATDAEAGALARKILDATTRAKPDVLGRIGVTQPAGVPRRNWDSGRQDAQATGWRASGMAVFRYAAVALLGLGVGMLIWSDRGSSSGTPAVADGAKVYRVELRSPDGVVVQTFGSADEAAAFAAEVNRLRQLNRSARTGMVMKVADDL